MVEESAIQRKIDSQSFDRVPGLYDEFRPGYPQELVDGIIKLSRFPQSVRILEVGSGTGKATSLFAPRGYAIHCIEPGGNLVEVAKRNLHDYPRVTFEITRFEDWQESPASFDLVMSAQAFHWISAETGYPKAARSLKPGGALALFWNMHPGFQGQVAEELRAIYREIAPELASTQDSIEETIQERTEEISRCGCFGPVTVHRFPWSCTYKTWQYIGLLNTHSDHIRLKPQTRQHLFDEISIVLNVHGGLIERDYVAVLYFAQKPS